MADEARTEETKGERDGKEPPLASKRNEIDKAAPKPATASAASAKPLAGAPPPNIPFGISPVHDAPSARPQASPAQNANVRPQAPPSSTPPTVDGVRGPSAPAPQKRAQAPLAPQVVPAPTVAHLDGVTRRPSPLGSPATIKTQPPATSPVQKPAPQTMQAPVRQSQEPRRVADGALSVVRPQAPSISSTPVNIPRRESFQNAPSQPFQVSRSTPPVSAPRTPSTPVQGIVRPTAPQKPIAPPPMRSVDVQPPPAPRPSAPLARSAPIPEGDIGPREQLFRPQTPPPQVRQTPANDVRVLPQAVAPPTAGETRERAGASAAIPAEPPRFDDGGKLRAIRTFHGDIAEAVKGRNVSLTTIALAENARKAKRLDVAEPVKKRSYTPQVIAISVGVLLIVFGAGAVGYLAMQGRDIGNKAVIVDRESLIFVESERELDLTDAARDKALASLMGIMSAEAATIGNITEIVPIVSVTDETGGTIKTAMKAPDFLERFETNVPDPFMRSLEDEFLVGIHAFGGNALLVIFRTTFFDSSFAAMLSWEHTIADDLPFLVRDRVPALRTSDVSEPTIVTEAASPVGTSFRDLVVENRDARALFDDAGNIRLIYSFPDRKTLVITTNRETLIEVLDRLTTARFTQ